MPIVINRSSRDIHISAFDQKKKMIKTAMVPAALPVTKERKAPVPGKSEVDAGLLEAALKKPCIAAYFEEGHLVVES